MKQSAVFCFAFLTVPPIELSDCRLVNEIILNHRIEKFVPTEEMAAGSCDCLTNKGDLSTANVRPEMKPGCCRWPVGVSGPVYLLVMLFSMSTWITIVGIWIEMPLMVNELPEGWSLPAYLSIVIQCSNLGPAVYGIVLKVRRPKNDTKRLTRHTCIDFDIILTFLLIGCAIISMFLLSFLWSVTSQVGGQKHSVVLFVLVSVASLVSCTSSVVFLPFMAKFAPPYITAYYIGQGMCGLIPGLLGLVQGIGQEPTCVNTTRVVIESLNGSLYNSTVNVVVPEYKSPLFSVNVYFGCLTSLLLLSLASFYCLNYTELCKKAASYSDVISKLTILSDRTPEGENLYKAVAPSDGNNPETVPAMQETITAPTSHHTKAPILLHRMAVLLTIVAIVNMLSNGLVPAIQSYTCLPYGSIAYTLSIRLASIAGPIASFSSMYLKTSSLPLLGVMTSAAVGLAVFQLVIAGQSPAPVLRGSDVGTTIIVISSVVMATLFSYLRVTAAYILRQEGGRRELFWCGGITQAGSFVGAILAFVLVQILHVFHSARFCG